MPDQSFQVPILLIVFNRPDTTAAVLAQVRKVKPQFLYIASDGPRVEKPGEEERCREVRHIIKNEINWKCEIKTLFNEENLGCRTSPVNAINWFFENVDQGIILEDDCLPDESFFYFCEEMLHKYKDDENILGVNGCNFNYSYSGNESYFYSRYINVWGWATWRRAAKQIDYDLKKWPQKNKLAFLWSRLRNTFFDLDLDWYRYWVANLDEVYSGSLTKSVWDYQWAFHLWDTRKKIIVSSKNLVVNIGFGQSATHTTLNNHNASALRLDKLTFPLKYPAKQCIDKAYEEEAIKPVWHLHVKKSNRFYLLNYINTNPAVQFIRSKLKV